MKSSGKVLTVFMVIIAFLLLSLTAISIFFFQKEVEKRKIAELYLQRSQTKESDLEEELKIVKKENFLLQEKHKEAEERVNDLSDELELEEGIREEMKIEITSLKEKLEKETKERETLQEQYNSQRSVLEQKVTDLESKLQAQATLKREPAQKDEFDELSFDTPVPEEIKTGEGEKKGAEDAIKIPVDLQEIVVIPDKAPSGRVLSVDKETEFVIINLGKKDGIKVGDFMAVYRGKNFLGDVRITRVHPEMSAADLVPPFSSQRVRKNDQVVTSQ